MLKLPVFMMDVKQCKIGSTTRGGQTDLEQKNNSDKSKARNLQARKMRLWESLKRNRILRQENHVTFIGAWQDTERSQKRRANQAEKPLPTLRKHTNGNPKITASQRSTGDVTTLQDKQR